MHQPAVVANEVGMGDGNGEMVHQLRALLNGNRAQGIRRAIALLHGSADAQIARCGPALANHKERMLV
jgi:hypothetical protein